MRTSLYLLRGIDKRNFLQLPIGAKQISCAHLKQLNPIWEGSSPPQHPSTQLAALLLRAPVPCVPVPLWQIAVRRFGFRFASLRDLLALSVCFVFSRQTAKMKINNRLFSLFLCLCLPRLSSWSSYSFPSAPLTPSPPSSLFSLLSCCRLRPCRQFFVSLKIS